MFPDILQELTGRGISVLIGLLLGGSITWVFARWKRLQERRSVARGDARDTVVITLHVVETGEGPGGRVPKALRIRAVGQAEVCRVVPNGAPAAVLLPRGFDVRPRGTPICTD